MLEIILRLLEHRRPCLRLTEHVLAYVSILRHHLPRLVRMLIIVTAEAAGEIEVPDVVGMRSPVYLHLREARLLENVLSRGNRLIDRRFLRRIERRIRLLIVG